MFAKTLKNSLYIFTAFILISCGGGGDTSIASPGELGSLTDPTGGGGTGGSSSNVLTGSCPESEFITNGSPVAGNTVCAIEGPITGELTLTNDVMYRMLNKVDVGIDMGGDGTKAGGVSGTLIIPAGIVIMGKTSNDYLVVNRGSKLIANGRDTRLQGQSDVIGNIQLGWDDFQNGSQGTLIINYVSDRVRARGIDVLPDVIEEPPLLVDFVYSKEIFYDTSILKLSLGLRNLLDEEYYASMASSVIYDQYKLGTSVSLGVKFSF
jgi:hypothetical protein